eukprot:10118415-Alexandrium_andersonii.AAC.1
MRRRQVPPAWVAVAVAFVEHRVAVCYRPDGAAVSRPAHAGVGVGGPFKPFLWRLGFDPVVAAVAAATASPAPTFVDDLSLSLIHI